MNKAAMNATEAAAIAIAAVRRAAQTGKPHAGDTRCQAENAERFARDMQAAYLAGNCTALEAGIAGAAAKQAADAHCAMSAAHECRNAADKGHPGVAKNAAQRIFHASRRTVGTHAHEAITSLAQWALREVARANDVQKANRAAAARQRRAADKAIAARLAA